MRCHQAENRAVFGGRFGDAWFSQDNNAISFINDDALTRT